MTRPEITYERPNWFSLWIRHCLPDSSTGFTVSDIDFVILNYCNKKFMILELKNFNKACNLPQRRILRIINSRLLKYEQIVAIANNKLFKYQPDGYKFLGTHCIRFTNTSFEDGECFFDNKIVTENELRELLSF